MVEITLHVLGRGSGCSPESLKAAHGRTVENGLHGAEGRCCHRRYISLSGPLTPPLQKRGVWLWITHLQGLG